jgi:hypothetical protein
MNRKSSVSIVTWLRSGRQRNGCPISDTVKRCFFLHSVQTSFNIQPASCPMGIGGYCPASRTVGDWSWTFLSIQCRGRDAHIFMAWCLIKKRRAFIFAFLLIINENSLFRELCRNQRSSRPKTGTCPIGSETICSDLFIPYKLYCSHRTNTIVLQIMNQTDLRSKNAIMQ